MKISLNDLRDSLSPEEVINLVTELGSDEYIEHDEYIIFKTICHNVDSSDASLKLYYYKRDHRFHCYTSCGDTFNIFELFKRRYELLGIEYSFYKDIILKITKNSNFKIVQKEGFYNEYVSDYDKYALPKIDINYTHINQNILNIYTEFATPEWINDGISSEAMKTFNILFSPLENKIIIPHYDIDNNLIGIRSRALNEEDIILGKYMPVKIENKIYSHPLMFNLYGLNMNKNNIKRNKFAIIAEGEKSAIQSETMFGRENNVCVACCGSKVHSYQINLLLAAGAEKILIAFDKTGETEKQQEQYYYKLKKMCDYYKLKCSIGFIYDFDGLLDLKESPFDKGKDVFLQLYKKGVWCS